ncbi:hypothetical protein G1C95_0793 [Bifidobacterium sp. DSM 109957]|uniref:Uncharacterized protein n=1 Tax=Bifidobacterium oedipodis TaxID=2675322 RepID=A0A7Y0ENL4_9BIFI|nr:hypothetical protein [Bifidobacterium sp. DSM 109957]
MRKYTRFTTIVVLKTLYYVNHSVSFRTRKETFLYPSHLTRHLTCTA